jgi:hypothetical protein
LADADCFSAIMPLAARTFSRISWARSLFSKRKFFADSRPWVFGPTVGGDLLLPG